MSYYSAVAFAAFSPLAVVYSIVAHIWVSTIGRNDVRALPPATDRAGERPKLAIVTGSNTGIGFETARTLVVEYHWEIILACRTREKAISAMNSINEQNNGGGGAIVLDESLDLTDFDSIERYSKAIRSRYPSRSIDVIVNNAGRNTTGKSGSLDLMFQANFLGHFALTSHLLGKMTPETGIVVNLSSVMHHFPGAADKTAEYWASMATYQASPSPELYSASKLAMLFFTNELNRRYSGKIRSVAVNPGACSSDIWRDFPRFIVSIFNTIYLTPRQGSTPVVAAALASEAIPAGTTYVQPYWLPTSALQTPHPVFEMLGPFAGFKATVPRTPTPQSSSLQTAQDLWSVSEKLTGVQFPANLK